MCCSRSAHALAARRIIRAASAPSLRCAHALSVARSANAPASARRRSACCTSGCGRWRSVGWHGGGLWKAWETRSMRARSCTLSTCCSTITTTSACRSRRRIGSTSSADPRPTLSSDLDGDLSDAIGLANTTPRGTKKARSGTVVPQSNTLSNLSQLPLQGNGRVSRVPGRRARACGHGGLASKRK